MARAWVPVALACIAIVGVAAAPMSVTAQDEWPDKCSAQQPFIEPGDHSGALSPSDRDVLTVNVPEGDFITVTLAYESPASEGQLHLKTSDGTLTDQDGTKLTAERSADPIIEETDNAFGVADLKINEGQVTFRLYSETDDNEMCIQLALTEEISGDWRMIFEEGESSSDITLGNGDQDVSSLMEQLEEKNETIDQLQSTIADHEETIAEQEATIAEQEETIADQEDTIAEQEQTIVDLEETVANQEDRIAELEAQLEAAQDDEQVVINVNVEPGSDQGYVDGGTALVTASSDQADLSDLTLYYQDEQYAMLGGELELTLQGTGLQELQFEYGDVTETVTLEVQEAAQDDGGDGDGDGAGDEMDDHEQDDGDDDGPDESDDSDQDSDADGDDGEEPEDGDEEQDQDQEQEQEDDADSQDDDTGTDDGDESATDDGQEQEQDDDGAAADSEQPGFGIVVAIVAVLAAAGLAVKRRFR